jgi:hypothetical protein
MEELNLLKTELSDWRKKYPEKRKFYVSFWDKAIPIARKVGPKLVSTELGIDYLNVVRRMKFMTEDSEQSFIQIPSLPDFSQVRKKITLKLPGDITLSIEL